ncbi:MAG: RNA-guided endonuclease InsQ/TnpB family protein [Nesterenkonia sp.]
MSYTRFGDDSDLYVYPHVAGGITIHVAAHRMNYSPDHPPPDVAELGAVDERLLPAAFAKFQRLLRESRENATRKPIGGAYDGSTFYALSGEVLRSSGWGESQILPTCRMPPDTVWVMKKRFTYRAYPTGGQQQLLARSLGCARAVFNDFVVERDRLYRAGLHREVSFAETGRKVLVESKTTDGSRPYLAEVSAAMLQQSVRDAEAGYRNFFASLAGKRKGPKMGRPRLKSKHNHTQRMRFARNTGFKVEDQSHQGHGFLTLPKIGRIRMVMSRSLPSAPSSVTVTAHADGTYEASFVVEVEPRKAPEPIHAAAGVDAGITSLAAVAHKDGTGHKIDNPRHLKARERKLARAQRALSRKQKGSKNRYKARIQVARQHRKVKVARLDHHHKQARGLVDDTHAIALEDLNVAGMVRNRHLAKALSDAGMSQFLRLISEKAGEAGRTVVTIDRWFPSSQLCSECGCPGGKKELAIRQWSCACCGMALDRDFNAAKNLMIAAGLAEIENACGGSIRPDPGLAEPTKQEPTELIPAA